MVSTLGLLDRGAVTLDGPVDCKKTFTVDGRSFKNSDNFELGSVPFHTDFAKSNGAVCSRRSAATSLGWHWSQEPKALNFMNGSLMRRLSSPLSQQGRRR